MTNFFGSSFVYKCGTRWLVFFISSHLSFLTIIHLDEMAATATYDLRFIESSAVAIVDTIILQKEPVGKVLARINFAAVCNIEYTGTVSLIVQKMIQILRRTNTPLYLHVKDEVVDRAVSTFINYWKVSRQYEIRVIITLVIAGRVLRASLRRR